MARSLLDELVDVAVDQHGYVRTRDAIARGIDGANLRKMAARGRLERVGRGLYRVPFLPRDEHDEYAEAVLWAEGRGIISHGSALALHQLCDINPSRLHLTVPPAYAPRRTGGELYRVWRRRLDPGDVTTVDGIPVVTAERAVRDGIASGIDPQMLTQAITTARREGLLTAAQATHLRRQLAAKLHRRTGR
ncbi:type IV toxin-antitoxin system AbiEi family antitoxin domain-containing protein [Micromonospora sp. NPDC000207]|uniref:type IV toxin-antitoxin system AbiEi family antitoxin domain-containing protein n=1 Tax=Micromonospora sp. NPDC000207 TaxID=3154246 RepID=UPI003327D84F